MPVILLDYHEDEEGRFAALLEHASTVAYHLHVPGLELDARAFTPKALRALLLPHIKTAEQVDGLIERAELAQPEAISLLDHHRRARAAMRLLAKLHHPL